MEHEKKTVTIYVNTEEHQVEKSKLTFQQIVKLAYPSESSNPNILFKVSYRLGRGHSELKTLAEGGNVQVQEGMIFNVSYETRS
ncbi:MAG: multiubiquitin domain-containing protein [Bacteroidetes bacterium]|nr:multiubiquitin domain-containing protein [Bacteroidota bacterium]